MHDLLSGLIDLQPPQRGQTLTRQLCDQVRTAILSGALATGQRLPSSRDLAHQLGLSRNTVQVAVEQLAMEGYLDVAPGRRPIVAASAPAPALAGRAAPARPVTVRPSHWAARLRDTDWPVSTDGRLRPFAPGFADARLFPHEVWARCLRRAARCAAAQRSAAVNRPALCAALLRHLAAHRGVKADIGQIMILPSAQAAITLAARVLLDPGDLAWLESPGYGGARAALDAAGARIRGVPLDAEGITIDAAAEPPRLIFVTPSHQYPTGGLMTVGRRRDLLAFAAASGAVIVEDDYDSEVQYDGRPVAALQGLDGAGSVVYVGTVSKSTFADIRLGYAVVPDALVSAFALAQRHAGLIAAAPVQDALAEFIDAGHFAAHIRRVTRLYRERRDHLVRALGAAAGDRLAVEPPAGGMQLVAELPPACDDRAVCARLDALGVMARPLSGQFIGPATRRGLFLGFAAWTLAEIEAGAEVVGRVLRA